MGRWYGYNLIRDGEVTEIGTEWGVGVHPQPPLDLVEGFEYDEAFLFYVNNTSDTGMMIHLPSRNRYKFTIIEGVPYLNNSEEPLFGEFKYNLTLCGPYNTHN